jgi:hypothetical protein
MINREFDSRCIFSAYFYKIPSTSAFLSSPYKYKGNIEAVGSAGGVRHKDLIDATLKGTPHAEVHNHDQ